MTADPLDANLAAARALLDVDLPDDPVELVRALSKLAERAGVALDEAMARAAVSGISSRTIAEAAGVAPNTVPPRLARSGVLATYAENGRVGAEGVAAARFELRRRTAPRDPAAEPGAADTLTFVPRKRNQ